MIANDAMDEDSNRARKARGRHLEVCRVEGEALRGPTLSFGSEDLLGVNNPSLRRPGDTS